MDTDFGNGFKLWLTALFLWLVVATSACGPVAPGVRYSLVTGPLRPEHFDTYGLQGSKLVVGPGEGADLAALRPSDLTVRSLPVEVPERRFALEHADALGVTGVVSIAKVENTELVKEIGLETTDRRLEWLNDLGTVAATVIPIVMAAALTGPTSQPIDLERFKASPKEVLAFELTALSTPHGRAALHLVGPGLTVDLEPVPVDAEPFPGLGLGSATSAFLHSACRAAVVTLEVKGPPGAPPLKVSRAVKVADPSFVQRVAFPPKGSLRMHSECGVSVSATADATQATEAAVLAALGAQAKAIREAIVGATAK